MAWESRLIRHFRSHQRKLPWRDCPEPYRVWVSEIMLQQTRVAAVVPYFERFIHRFPSVETLAGSELQDVLRLWEGLGYYSRARNLHKAAREIVDRFGGKIPSELESLQSLPGIGRYTAAAVASIAYGVPMPVVDGNVLRVMARFRGIAEDIRLSSVAREMEEWLLPYIRQSDPSAFNQAMMELGALVCVPRSPDCGECPLRQECVAYREGTTGVLPVKGKVRKGPHYQIAVGVIWRRGRILIARRREDQMLGGLWEFPGGKREPGETLEETCRREIREETGLRVRVGRRLAVVAHAYSHFSVTLTAYRCEWLAGVAHARSADEVKWIRVRDLPIYPFPSANRRIAAAVEKEA